MRNAKRFVRTVRATQPFSDHLCYRDEGFPAIMLADTALFRNPNYHKHTDTVETLDFEAMALITKNLVSAMRNLSLGPKCEA